MCTYAFHVDPDAAWPFVIAGNRDEVLDRAWLPPAEHWDDRPGVIGGLDHVAGGTWAGVNNHGVVAVILNRWQTLGPASDKRSRGELVLDALDFADAAEVASAFSALSPDAYRGFNMIVADKRECFWLRNDMDDGIKVQAVGAGTHLISHGNLDDLSSRRVERYKPQFEFLGPPAAPNEASSWAPWRELLCDSSLSPANDETSGLRVHLPKQNFGTSSQSFMALHHADAVGRGQARAVYWFAAIDDEALRRLL